MLEVDMVIWDLEMVETEEDMVPVVDDIVVAQIADSIVEVLEVAHLEFHWMVAFADIALDVPW